MKSELITTGSALILLTIFNWIRNHIKVDLHVKVESRLGKSTGSQIRLRYLIEFMNFFTILTQANKVLSIFASILKNNKIENSKISRILVL